MNDISCSPGSDFRCVQYMNMNDENEDPNKSNHFNYLTKYEMGFPFADQTNILYESETYSDNDWHTLSDIEDHSKQKEVIDKIGDGVLKNCKLNLAHNYANSLCKVISLPRTFRWVMCEWFYSNLDRPLLLGNNDFRSCLNVRFPYLKTRHLTRGHWLLVKRLIGKPRRSSPKFFYQERKELSEKRQKLRTMERLVSIAASSGAESLLSMSMDQNLLATLPIDFKLSPRLSPGTAVIVRIYQPNPGIFTGVVQEEAKVYPNYGVFIDLSILMVPSNDAASQSEYVGNWYGYRIIPDTDVIGVKPPDNLISVADLHAGASLSDAILTLTDEGKNLIANGDTSVNLRKYYKHTRHILADQMKIQPPPVESEDFMDNKAKVQQLDFQGPKMGNVHPASQSSNSASSQSSIVMSSPRQNPASVSYNCSFSSRNPSRRTSYVEDNSAYSMEFLYHLMKVNKLIDLKSSFVKKLRSMNDEAQLILTEHNQKISLEFQHNYATLIVQLDNLKKEITQYFTLIVKHTEEISQEQNISHLNQTLEWRRKCDEEAAEIIKSQEIQGNPLITPRNFELISKLMTLLMQIRNLANTHSGFSELRCVQSGMKDIKAMISELNIEIFEAEIEQKVNQILDSINQYASSTNCNSMPPSMISAPQ